MIVRLLLGDQLHIGHAWFAAVDDDVVYAIFEMRQETDYARHHIQKVIAFFAAMRAFAEALQAAGHRVHYVRLDDPDNAQTLPGNLERCLERFEATAFEYQLPDEWRLDEQLRAFADGLELPTRACDSEHFITARDHLHERFGKRDVLMETFYRDIRRELDLLLEDGEPIGGRWNHDASNRKRLPRDHRLPEPKVFDRDVRELEQLIREAGVQTIGEVEAERFAWPVSRAESLELLEHFVDELLPSFGSYQDAMTVHGWSLYHARLSFSLNVKLLTPLEVVRRAIRAFEQRPEAISIAQVEGFVRQIIGWREYMRAVYWSEMPGYAATNALEHRRPLPGWFWTGETKMSCLHHSIRQSLERSYAHHIQRLMVTGNFALLAGVDPDEVDAWYLGIYIDAIEWVEITNTRGMSQYADGGLVGTKPYVSSASYIHKMSDYCAACPYDPRRKTGDRACPFNSLYWHFHHRHRERLASNHRVAMTYGTWDRMDCDQREALLAQAEDYLERIESL